MTKDAQIQLLFSDSEKELDKIGYLFKESVASQHLDTQVLLNIKKYLETLRSILDYTAKDIFDKYCTTVKPVSGYFPILNSAVSEEIIGNRINGTFPGLKSSNKNLFEFFLKIQPSQDIQNKWLEDFNNLCNENKHLGLTIQVRKDDVVNVLTFNDGRIYFWTDGLVRFDDVTKGITIHPTGLYGCSLTSIDEHEWFFHFGWKVHKLQNYKPRSAPDLTVFAKDSYELESFVVGNFYFPNRQMCAISELNQYLSKIKETTESLSKLL